MVAIDLFTKLLAGFLSAVLASMGMGGGSILIIYLTLLQQLPQQQAQGMNLLFFLPVGAVALYLHHRHGLICWKPVPWMVAAGLAGVLLGTWAAQALEEAVLRKAFAVFLAMIGIRELWPAKKRV